MTHCGRGGITGSRCLLSKRLLKCPAGRGRPAEVLHCARVSHIDVPPWAKQGAVSDNVCVCVLIFTMTMLAMGINYDDDDDDDDGDDEAGEEAMMVVMTAVMAMLMVMVSEGV